MIITDAALAGKITTTVTIIGFCVVALVWRFGHNLHAAIDKRDRDEAEDRENARMLARVARSIDAMDESERARFELFV